MHTQTFKVTTHNATRSDCMCIYCKQMYTNKKQTHWKHKTLHTSKSNVQNTHIPVPLEVPTSSGSLRVLRSPQCRL